MKDEFLNFVIPSIIAITILTLLGRWLCRKFWQRLAEHKKELKQAEAALSQTEQVPSQVSHTADERRPSFGLYYFPFYLLAYFLLPWLSKTRRWLGWLGAALFFLFLGFVLWESFSKRAFEDTRRSYPSYPRNDYILNSLMYHLIIPLLLIAGIYLIMTFPPLLFVVFIVFLYFMNK